MHLDLSSMGSIETLVFGRKGLTIENSIVYYFFAPRTYSLMETKKQGGDDK